MRREPPTEREAWLHALQVFDDVHDELLDIIEMVAEEEEERRGPRK